MPLFEELKRRKQNQQDDTKYLVRDAQVWADTLVDGIENTELGWGNDGRRIVDMGGSKIFVLVDFALRPTAQMPSERASEELSLTDSEEEVTEESTGDQKSRAKWEESATDSVLNLQYFFPLCDQALRNDPRREIILVIACTGDDVWRVRRYLGAQNRVKPRLCICTAVAERGREIAEAEIVPIYYSVKDIKNLLPLFCVGSARDVRCEKTQDALTDDLTVKVLSDTNEELYNCCAGGKKIKIDAENRPQYTMLLRTGEYIIEKINKKIMGTVKTEPGLTDRKNRRKAFWKIINAERGGLKRQSLLTQVIWLSTLWHLMEQDELGKGTAEEPFAKDRIYLALWDAIAYGEGILQLLENSESHSQHKVGYLSICIHDVGLKQISGVTDAAGRRLRIYRKYRLNRFDSFIQPDECCYLEFNVIDMGRTKEYAAKGIEVRAGRSLKELFDGTADQSIDHVIHHYGMPLFYRTVLKKNGRFICRTPAGKGNAVQFLHGWSMRKTQPEPQYDKLGNGQVWTSYQVLLPLSFRHYPAEGIKTSHSRLFDDSFLAGTVTPYQYEQRLIEKEKLYAAENHKIDSTEDKIAAVEEISQNLKAAVGRDDKKTVFVLKLTGLSAQSLELYIKGLFRFIAGEGEVQSERRLLFRLVFVDEFALSEALRRFAIFYNRFGKTVWMKHTQIALCVLEKSGKDGGSLPRSHVRLILAGQHIYEAYITAKQYMHYNADIDSGFLLSQVEYLARFEKDSPKAISGVPLFPFDIVEDNNGQSDFSRKIETHLNSDLQEVNYGCRIVDAHVRLGSKIHIKDFYDAELLFQSISNVYRFAYILAGEIYQNVLKAGADQYTKLLLIGYENYSFLLVEEVKRLLIALMTGKRAKQKMEIKHLSFVKTPDDSGKIVPGKNELEKEDQKLVDQQTAVVIVLPIGTTLSTIYKIKNVFQRELDPRQESTVLDSHVLILVDDSAPAGEKLSGEYWRDLGLDKPNRVKLRPESQDAPQSMEARWYFRIETKWMKPVDCELCGKAGEDDKAIMPLGHIPLGQVDKTSTIPGLIFPLKGAEICHGSGFSARGTEEEQRNRLSKMKKCIDYGHVHREWNHYQFYIQYEKYYKEVREDCIQWLVQQRQELGENEFNIIISPLQYENSLFVKDVIDHVFQHSLRFIYLPLDQVYREEIRSRFSYIAQEYENACAGTQPPKYNVYFVDYSVVSGQSLRRSEMLIRMLMNDATTSENIRIFRKVILLLNRSSYDTAAVFVREPTTDFVAYATLQIPYYNTLSNSCPACEMVDTYETIAKCSATNEMYWHYRGLIQKHQLRSPTDHREWIEKSQFTHHHYLGLFYQSLSLDVIEVKAKDEPKKSTAMEAIEKAAGGTADGELPGLTLQKIVNDSSGDGKTIKWCYEAYLATRDWRRLLCTHQAVGMVERLSQTNWDIGDVASEAWNVLSQGVCKYERAAVRREWLISYVKTLSRGYPAKFAPVRRAVYTLLELLFLELLELPGEEYATSELWKTRFRKGMPDPAELDHIRSVLKVHGCENPAETIQLYQVYLILAKRLCDLQSNLLLQHSVLVRIQRFLRVLKERNEALLREMVLKAEQTDGPEGKTGKKALEFLIFPKDSDIQTDYLRLIKWAAMSSKEESKAFMLQKLSKDISDAEQSRKRQQGGDGQGDWHPLDCEEFSKIIRVENTRVLYSGIKRLHERTRQIENWKPLKEEIQTIWENAYSPEDREDYLAQNPMMELFRFMDLDFGGKLGSGQEDQRVEVLAALLGFYRRVDCLDKDGGIQENKEYMEQYNNLCLWLSRIGGYKNCFMIHRSNHMNQIIAQYFSETIERLDDVVDQVLDRAIAAAGSWYGGMSMANTVYTDSKTGALVIALRISRNADMEHLQTIYIVLLNENENDGNPAMAADGQDAGGGQMDIRVYYILFMRQSLQKILERDLYALHHFRNGLEDVRRIDGSRPLRILHITDMHISAYNQRAIMDLIKSNSEQLKDGNPELMVVTGDIVQGNNSAADLEENYKYAAQALRAIAEILWSVQEPDGRTVLRNDWKKRIIIIPGNHDYASMNELSASHTLRATTGGVPVLRNGTPMSKYAYYIQFLQDFLGIESSQSIRRNLNSFLEYPDLKLRIIALNSVAEVGPIRNNKMQLDNAFIQFVCNKRPGANVGGASDDYLTIALAHHTRCYDPDYFADRYYEKGLTPEVFALTKKIIELCHQGQKELGQRLSSGRRGEVEGITKKTNKMIKELEKKHPQEMGVFEQQCSKTILFSDISYLREHWSELTNERCAQILFDYKRNQAMARFDLRIYQERLKLLEEKFPLDFMLGGHTHRAGQTEITEPKKCVEGARFYTEHAKTRLHFGFLDITDEENGKRSCNYVFSGKTQVEWLRDSSKLPDPPYNLP